MTRKSGRLPSHPYVGTWCSICRKSCGRTTLNRFFSGPHEKYWNRLHWHGSRQPSPLNANYRQRQRNRVKRK